MFGLVVRFICGDEASAEAFDQLVAQTIPQIEQHERGTLAYASHLVEGRPLERIFYELYRDRAAFQTHEEHTHTSRFLEQRAQYLASYEIDWLTLQSNLCRAPTGYAP